MKGSEKDLQSLRNIVSRPACATIAATAIPARMPAERPACESAIGKVR